MYLGLPLGASYKLVTYWHSMEKRVHKMLDMWKLIKKKKRLDMWKRGYLSKGEVRVLWRKNLPSKMGN